MTTTLRQIMASSWPAQAMSFLREAAKLANIRAEYVASSGGSTFKGAVSLLP